MADFHNPYHFVPVVPTTADGPRIDAFPDSLPDRVSFAMWDSEQLSGRLVCRLTTAMPLVIGAAQTKRSNFPTRVLPFRLAGQPAIPGSSLRGLISATAEAASNSILRILNRDWDTWENGRTRTGAHQKSSAVAEFAKIDPDLVPLGKSPHRKFLTAAELLFGVVEDLPSEQRGRRERAAARHRSGRALAGRVRFSNATAFGPVRLGQEVVLRELSSPKPPRASFYFQPKSGKKIPAPDSRPKGRKFYLAHSANPQLQVAAKTSGPTANHRAAARKLAVRPIPAESEFWFTIDFDNLGHEELELLCYALAPADSYVHRLGMGKPLGLGMVHIDVAGVFLVNRRQRYAEDPLDAPVRYHECWTAAFFAALLQERAVAARFAAEADAVAHAARLDETPAERARRFRATAVPEIVESLEMLGRRSLVRFPVHYPAKAGRSIETNLYEWFVGSGEYLVELPNGGVLPSLRR